MKPNSSKNQNLIKQYPFVTDIMLVEMEPFGESDNTTSIDDLIIKIEKVDGDLMFRQASNLGLGETTCGLSTRENRKNQIMRRGEYIFAINYEGKIINQRSWPRNRSEQRDVQSEIYAHTVLWTKTETSYIDPIEDEVKYLVWVTVEAWYETAGAWHEKDSKGTCPFTFGKFIDRRLNITIYNKPDEGFKNLRDRMSLAENLLLDDDVLIRGIKEKDIKIINITGRLSELCRLFQDDVYFKGMKAILDKGEFQCASGQLGPIKVSCCEMCEYNRVTLKDNVSQISFQLRPEAKMMYVLSCNGTLPQLRNLVKTIISLWNNRPEMRTLFKSDSEVSII